MDGKRLDKKERNHQVLVAEVSDHDPVDLDEKVSVFEAGLFGLRVRPNFVDEVSSASRQADL